MHELKAAQALFDTAIKNVPNNAKKVKRINIVTGALSAITEDHLQFHMDELSRGTILEGAKVKLTVKPISETYIESIDIEEK